MGSIIALVMMYPLICEIWLLPNLFAILVGIAVGAVIRTVDAGIRTSIFLVGIFTFAAINSAHFLTYIHMKSELGETLWSLESFLSWIDTTVFEIWDPDLDSAWVIRGFGAFLFGIFYEWLVSFLVALFTISVPTSQNSSETEPNN